MSENPYVGPHSSARPTQKLNRLKKIRNAGGITFVISLTIGWIATWIIQKKQKSLESDTTITDQEILSELRLLLAVLFAIGLAITLSAIITLTTIILVGVKSKAK